MAERSGNDNGLDIYEDFLICIDKYSYFLSFIDESALPHKKYKIYQSIRLVFFRNSDHPDIKEPIKAHLHALSHFQEGIGEKPIFGMPTLEKVDFPKVRKTLSEKYEDLDKTASPEEYLQMQETLDQKRFEELETKAEAEYQSYIKGIDEEWLN